MMRAPRAWLKGLASNLGRCPFCIRTAFRFAMAVLIVAVGASAADPKHAVFFMTAALLGASLWTAHILAFASRATAAQAKDRSFGDVRTGRLLSRRAAAVLFVRNLGLIAAATALPLSVVRAAGDECPAASGSHCDDQTPYCCYSPSRNLYYCRLDVNHCDL